MSDIDDKLREIIAAENRHSDETSRYDMDGLIAQIHKAFADEGYIQIPTATKEKDGFIRINPEGIYMTGGHWYDRFCDEYVKLETDDKFEGLEDKHVKALLAAKRASGLSNKGKE